VRFPLFRWFNAGLDRLSHIYARGVRELIRLRRRCWGCSWRRWMRPISSRCASPQRSSRSRIKAIIQLRTDAVAKQVRDILKSTPGVEIVGSISGLNFLSKAAQSNTVEIAILKPWDQRPPEQNASTIVASVHPKLLQIAGAIALSFDPPFIPGHGTTGGSRSRTSPAAAARRSMKRRRA
jgi:HAE1 family hydrophobic/amphiphilic exporter-1